MKRQTQWTVFICSIAVCFVFIIIAVFEAVNIVLISRQLGSEREQNKKLSSEIQSTEKKYKDLQNKYDQLKTDTMAKDANAKVAYLTFDDGPSRRTVELLDTLKSCNVHATFFVIGINAQKEPGILKTIISEGNAVGIHSWTHSYPYIYSSTANFMADFNRLSDYIKNETGETPDICRFPGGTNNTISNKYCKHIMQQIVPIVTGMGIKPFDWNVDSGDAVKNVPTKAQIISTVISQTKRHKKAIILFHDADQHESSIQAVPEIVSQLRKLGYTFGTLTPNSPTIEFTPS